MWVLILSLCVDAFESSTAGSVRRNRTRLNNVLMQLRKCVAHPYLFYGTIHLLTTARQWLLAAYDSLFGRWLWWCLVTLFVCKCFYIKDYEWLGIDGWICWLFHLFQGLCLLFACYLHFCMFFVLFFFNPTCPIVLQGSCCGEGREGGAQWVCAVQSERNLLLQLPLVCCYC